MAVKNTMTPDKVVCKTFTVLFTINFMPSKQMSTHWKRQRTTIIRMKVILTSWIECPSLGVPN